MSSIAYYVLCLLNIADNEELLNEKLRLDQAANGIRKDN